MISECFNDTMCSLSYSFAPSSILLSCRFLSVLSLFSTSFCTLMPVHTQKIHSLEKPSQQFGARSLANELSYWNRKQSALCCRKCCYGKPYRGGMEGKLLVRTKKHENVLSLQMYQFTFIRSRLHQFLPYAISFLPSFSPPSYHISLSLIKHHLVQ